MPCRSPGRQRAPPSRRERELLATWQREWLGPLEPVLEKTGLEFERGFLTRCAWNGEAEPTAVANAAEWATVTHLDLTGTSRVETGTAGLMLSPAFRSLRHVLGVGSADLRQIAKARTALPWETLTIRATARAARSGSRCGGPCRSRR